MANVFNLKIEQERTGGVYLCVYTGLLSSCFIHLFHDCCCSYNLFFFSDVFSADTTTETNRGSET